MILNYTEKQYQELTNEQPSQKEYSDKSEK